MDNKITLSEELAHNIIKKRLLAAWIDIFILFIPMAYLNDFLFFLIFPLNYVILPHYKGYTVGMFLMGIRLIKNPYKNDTLKVFLLFKRILYFFVVYPWENIQSKGVVKINQIGQTKLDQKFDTTVVFKNSLWNETSSKYVYESHLHHVIFFSIILIYFILIVTVDIFKS